MKQIYASILFLMCVLTTNAQNTFWTPTDYRGAFSVTDNTPATDWTYGWSNWDANNTVYPVTQTTVSSDVTTNTTWSGVILLQNKVYVKNNATLTILPGTIIRGDYQTQGTLIITRGSKLIADGEQFNPIVHGGTNDNDDSGVIRFVRIEFAGIALEPNKEINGLTFGSVGNQTLVDYVQVSNCGDDSFEWFGGTVNCKHLISYSCVDDDFDTDFGYRGNVQFGLSIRNENLSDAVGDSNCFESDNDAQGSVAQPLTAPIFSNFTIIGAKSDGTVSLPIGEKFEKAFRLRRNTATSVFNTIVTGWEKGLSIEGLPVEDNILGDTMHFHSNILSNFNPGTVCITITPGLLSSYFSQNANDSVSTHSNINWVTPFVPLGLIPDYRLQEGSTAAVGASFPQGVFGDLASVKEKSDDFIIYPNPASDVVYVSKKSYMEIINQNGQVINTVNDSKIDLRNLPEGVYFLRVNKVKTKKLIIKK